MTLKKLFASLVTGMLAASAAAQDYHDITASYLKNALFDSNYNYTVAQSGNVAQEILPLEGWTAGHSVAYTIVGVYQIGTKMTFNGASVPAQNADGTTEGGVLALSTGWEQTLVYYQTVSLPAGNYRLESAYYNGDAAVTAGRSVLGWVPAGGTAKTSTVNSFASGQWVKDVVEFSLTAPTEGRIQIGLRAAASGSANTAKISVDYVKLLRDTPYGEADLTLYKQKLVDAIAKAEQALGNGTGNGAAELKQAIEAARQALEAAKTPQDVDQALAALEQAIDTFLWANPTGSVPTVTTNPKFVRGSTMAFGRMTLVANGATVTERGFCYGTDSQPTINDQRATTTLSHNGLIYWLKDLTPGTRYYMRAYAITSGRQVAYGDVVKFYTVPKGNVTFNLSGGDQDTYNRIKAAAEGACYYFNNMTSTTRHFDISYSPGTPTADCDYKSTPHMNVGANTSYQRTGTIMHEMEHGMGLQNYSTQWSKANLRAGNGTGIWLGDRVTEALHFWDNNTTTQLNGDNIHMWPYGVNGAQEDDGTDALYLANAMICQALGEDGLEHNEQRHADPYYALDQDDNTKYYLKNESAERGYYTAYLIPSQSGVLSWRNMSVEEAAQNDSTAWYITFTPENQYYQLRNAATGQYLTYQGGIRTAARSALTALENWHLMKGRVDVDGQRGYWIIHPETGWSPHCLQANQNGLTASATFNIANSAETQRWLILTQEQMKTLESAAVGQMRKQADDALARIKALSTVPHREDVAGADQQLAATLESLTARMASAATTTDLQAVIEEAQIAANAFLESVTATDANQPFDLTYMLVNPTIDSSADGWSQAATINYGCGEYYQTTFDFYQVVRQLPAGTYQFCAQGFQRPGPYASAANVAVNAQIYAGTVAEKMAHITADAQTSKVGSGNEVTIGGKYVPNDMQAASAYFKKGLYENRVTNTVTASNGALKMGLRSTSMGSSYWAIFDNFRLYFFGRLTADELLGVDAPAATPAHNRPGTYTIDGRQMAPDAKLMPSIYIRDGRKVVVR